MHLLASLAISSSALTAERARLDLIANNLANLNSTRTQEGGPYRRKVAIFSECLRQVRNKNQVPGYGVRMVAIAADPSPPQLVYDPRHPDADAQGYVTYPNVNVVNEMVDLITATRAYEANVTVINATKDMVLKAFEIGRT